MYNTTRRWVGLQGVTPHVMQYTIIIYSLEVSFVTLGVDSPCITRLEVAC